MSPTQQQQSQSALQLQHFSSMTRPTRRRRGTPSASGPASNLSQTGLLKHLFLELQALPRLPSPPSPFLFKGTARRKEEKKWGGQPWPFSPLPHSPSSLSLWFYLLWLFSSLPVCLQACPGKSPLSSGKGATWGLETWGRRATFGASLPCCSGSRRSAWRQIYKLVIQREPEAADPCAERKQNYSKHLRLALLLACCLLPSFLLPSPPTRTQRRIFFPLAHTNTQTTDGNYVPS